MAEHRQSLRRWNAADAAPREALCDLRVGGHADGLPWSPVHTERREPDTAPEVRESVEKCVRRRVCTLARRPEHRRRGGEEDEEVERLVAELPVQQPTSNDLCARHRLERCRAD